MTAGIPTKPSRHNPDGRALLYRESIMTYWLYPANTKYYDVLGAFSERIAYWPAKTKVAVGDSVLIYLSAPYKQIGFQTEVA
jgi:hypothetical protein